MTEVYEEATAFKLSTDWSCDNYDFFSFSNDQDFPNFPSLNLIYTILPWHLWHDPHMQVLGILSNKLFHLKEMSDIKRMLYHMAKDAGKEDLLE